MVLINSNKIYKKRGTVKIKLYKEGYFRGNLIRRRKWKLLKNKYKKIHMGKQKQNNNNKQLKKYIKQ